MRSRFSKNKSNIWTADRDVRLERETIRSLTCNFDTGAFIVKFIFMLVLVFILLFTFFNGLAIIDGAKPPVVPAAWTTVASVVVFLDLVTHGLYVLIHFGRNTVNSSFSK